MKKLKSLLYFAIPPLIVLISLMWVFRCEGLYPFGSGTVSWCDMNQQTIPLLMNFKDILEGKSGFFLNMNNAGGMNFYGVFFFFLASPFSFLVKFVDKSDMMTFVNILVVLKLMTASVTAAFYFRRCKRHLDPVFVVALSVMYAFCGYGMLFYQNLIWLDMMYLMPLLAVSLEELTKRQNNIPYILAITAMLVVNYYISYMTVVYIMIFMAVYACRRAKNSRTSEVCVKFISGSVIGALLSAAVWLPCFIQYLSSGRKKSVIATLENSDIVSHYQTVLPLLFCSAFLFAAIAVGITDGSLRKQSSKDMLILFGLLLIPFFIEPVNIMWHTGNYMSFPARYGFITVFAGLVLCSDFLSRQKPVKAEKRNIAAVKYTVGALLTVGIIAFYINFSNAYFEQKWETLSAYTRTLWGDDSSFRGLAVLFFAGLLCYLLLCFIRKKGGLGKRAFGVALCVMAAAEGCINTHIYLATSSRRWQDHNDSFQQTVQLADSISNDSFYRVATDKKLMDYNLVGALGYPSLSHYTSLTDQDFMFFQKRMGYTTVWMEAGSGGGTELTDALYSVGYRITAKKDAEDEISSNGRLSIVPQKYKLGLGILTDSAVSQLSDIPSEYTRGQSLQYVYSAIFGGEKPLITQYSLSETQSEGVTFKQGKFNLSKGSEAVYSVDVKGRQSLYADCFDVFSNSLSENYFGSLTVRVNGRVVASDYPSKTNNGVLKLGEYENQRVEVTLKCSKDISCYSFGVFGLDLDLLENSISQAKSIELTDNRGRLEGKCTLDKPQTCVVAVPYNDGFTVKVNGKKVPYYCALSDFIAFELPKGESSVEISFTPKGFRAGVGLTVLGIAAFAAYVIFRQKINPSKRVKLAAQAAVMFACLAVITMVYIIPVIVCFIGY